MLILKIVLIVLAVIAVALVVLMILGRRLQKKQEASKADIEAATRMIEGTARSMGIEIVD